MATGATEFIDATTAAAYIVTLYSKEAIIAREAALVMANLVNRQFEKEVTYGGTLNVPSIGNLSGTASKNTSSNAAVSFETITESNTSISIGTWDYSAIAIETFTKQQASQDLIARYAPKQGYALALLIDTNLFTYPSGVSNSVGSLTTELLYEDVLRAMQYLDDANAPLEDRALVISPAQRAGFMKLDQFVNRDYESLQQGTDRGQLMDRMRVGTWMDIPTWVSTNVKGSNAAGHDNTMFQKEALALVVQMDATTHYMFDINYLAHKYVVEHIYGSAKIRDDHMVYAKGA